MATGNRKRSATGKKSSSGRKTNSGHKRNTKKQQEREAEFTREVILWIVVAVSLLLFISNFGFGGTIGGTVSRFFFGLFGIISYIFPIVLLVGTFFAVSNQGNRVAAVKLVAVILFVAFLCMFFELISDGTDAKSAMDAYRYSFDAKSGGGLIGGGLSHMLCSGFGVIGAYVIDVIVLIISLVLITERSAFRGMQKGGRRVYESAKISSERHRERVEMRREEREQREQQRRMDRKVEGVAIDTKLIPDTPQKRSQDISEILPEDMIDLPEIKEEKHVTLTAGSTISNTTPSAFSDEALDAMGQALTAKTELFAAEEEQVSFPIQMEEPKASRTVAEEAPFVIPGRPDPAMAFGMEQGAEEIPYEEETDTISLFGADLESEPLPEETAEDAARSWESAVDMVDARIPARISPARIAAITPCWLRRFAI